MRANTPKDDDIPLKAPSSSFAPEHYESEPRLKTL
jgi:hypothetical protein